MSVLAFVDSLASHRAALALFVRHAERPALPDDASGHEVSLTRAGEDAARALGRELGARLASVRTSPIARCVETGRAMLEGAARDDAPRPDRMLGDPGPFVADLERAWSDWRRLGHDGVLARLTSGIDVIPGLHPLRATSHRLRAHALDTIADAPGVHVFVTHDVVLAPLAACSLARALSQDEWPDFLEPLAFVRDAHGTRMRYRAHVATLEGC